MTDRSRDLDDAVPIELDSLERWEVAERILAARLAGASLEACLAAERARGPLPPGELAAPLLEGIIPAIEQLVAVGQSDIEPSSLDVNVSLSDDDTLIGTVAHLRGDVLHTVTYSSVSPAHRLIAWARLLALSAAWPERPFQAMTIGRARRGAKGATITAAVIPALGADAASRQEAGVDSLRALLDLYRRGMREPLPIYNRTSAAWAEATRAGQDPRAAAGKCWTSDYDFAKEDGDPEHVLVLGSVLDFEAVLVLAGVPHDDETGGGWASAEHDPLRPSTPGGSGTACSTTSSWSTRDGDGAAGASALRRLRSASRAASPCSRPAPEPARRSPSPPSPPATSRPACLSTGCSS